jgi:hypothetical protein
LLQEFQAPEDLRRRADEAWEKFQSQAGFALVARRLLKDAMVRGPRKRLSGCTPVPDGNKQESV